MPSWLCKIWRFLANLFGKIVDFIVEVLDTLLNLAVKAIKGIADAIFGDGPGLLFWLIVGVGGYFLLTSGGKKDDQPSQTNPSFQLTSRGT